MNDDAGIEHRETVEQIAEALERFVIGNPGLLHAPRSRARGDGEIAVWNTGSHPLPAAVFASVLGTRRVDRCDPAHAVATRAGDRGLAPAVACTYYDHPNLAAWRRSTGADIVAEFIA